MKLSQVLVDEAESIASARPQETTSRLAFSMCALAAIFYCFEYYLRVAPSVMSTELKSAFSLSEAAFGNLAACYYYAYTPMQIPVGMMLDKFGSRRILTFASFLCVLGTYLFATTTSIHIAQCGRFLIGFGSAFAYVGVLKISNNWLPQKYFALMVGVATTLGMVGAISGELSMAYFVQKVGWQSTLNGSIVFGMLLTLLIWAILRDNEDEVLFHRSSSDKRVKDTAEKIKVIPLIQGLFKIIKSSQMWLIGIIGCLTYLPISAFSELWAVPFLETIGYTKQGAALGSSMIFLGFAIGGPCWGLFSDLVKSRRMPLIIGSLIATILMFFVVRCPNQTQLCMYLSLLLCGFAASAQVLVFAIANDITPSSVNATAIAFTNMVVMLGGMILPPVIGKILDNNVSIINGLPVYDIKDYTLALMILPVSLLISGAISLFIKESHRNAI